MSLLEPKVKMPGTGGVSTIEKGDFTAYVSPFSGKILFNFSRNLSMLQFVCCIGSKIYSIFRTNPEVKTAPLEGT